MNRKNNLVIIAGLLVFSLLCGCGSVNVNINSPKASANGSSGSDTASSGTDDLASFPQLTSKNYDFSKYDDDKNKYFDVHGTIWSLTDDSAKQYPNLVAPLKEIADNEKKFAEDSISQYDNEAKSFFEDNKKSGYNGGGYECVVDTGLACGDPKVLSLVSTQETFFGGAHPDTATLTFNLDSQTGDFIPLSDIIKDRAGLDAILKDALTKQYPDHNFFDLDDSLSKLKTDADVFDRTPYMSDPTYVYAFSPNGLTFFFNAAVLSPHSDGGEQIDLTYDDLSSELSDKYLHLYD